MQAPYVEAGQQTPSLNTIWSEGNRKVATDLWRPAGNASQSVIQF